MPAVSRRHRLLFPGLMTIAMLVVLIGLGTWQVERLQWKQALIAQIDQAEQAPPVPLPVSPSPFTKIVATGHLREDLAARYGAEVRDTPAGTEMGTHLIVPLEREQGPPILVDRGWVPQTRKAAIDQPEGTVSVVGYVRQADKPGWFSPADDPVGRQFYTLNPAAIGAALGLGRVAPFTLVALAPDASASHFPVAARHLPRPPNNHLSYALTWYGLALALIAIFTVWARQRSTS